MSFLDCMACIPVSLMGEILFVLQALALQGLNFRAQWILKSLQDEGPEFPWTDLSLQFSCHL